MIYMTTFKKTGLGNLRDKCYRTISSYNQSCGGKRDLKYLYRYYTIKCRCCMQYKGSKMFSQNFADFMDQQDGGI